jgi:hypothetical protein
LDMEYQMSKETYQVSKETYQEKSLPGLDMEYHPIAWSRTNVLQFEEMLDAEHADISCRAKALGPRAFALQILPDGH